MKELVTYEMSKKLQEKGFPQHLSENFYADGSEVATPTIYEVMEWFRNYKNIHVEIRLFFKKSFGFDIISIDDMKKLGWSGTITYPRYELCAISAINYVIDKII